MLFIQTMPHRKKIHLLWLIVASYGVWFAVISGIEEMISGKFWKSFICLVLGIASYFYIEYFINRDS